jgi:hypothetical protein
MPGPEEVLVPVDKLVQLSLIIEELYYQQAIMGRSLDSLTVGHTKITSLATLVNMLREMLSSGQPVEE